MARSRRSRKSALRSFLKKVKAYPLPSPRSLATKALRVSVIALAFSAVAVNAPEAHEDYLLASVGQSVVKLTQTDEFRRGGTGFAVKWPDGTNRIISNAHVCSAGAATGYMAAHTQHGTIALLRILRVDSSKDLCLLQGVPNIPALSISSSGPSTNQKVGIVGHALLNPLTLSKGRILARTTIFMATSAKEGEECRGEVQQFFIFTVCVAPYSAYISDALTYPGNSGSPVVDFWGNVVAVVFASDTRSSQGLFVPYEELIEFLELSR